MSPENLKTSAARSAYTSQANGFKKVLKKFKTKFQKILKAQGVELYSEPAA
jgi:hypothetical protein